MVDRGEFGGEQLLQPGLLDGSRQRKIGGHTAARLDLIDFRRNQQLGVTDGGFAAELAGTTVHQGAAEGARIKPNGEAVGKAEQ